MSWHPNEAIIATTEGRGGRTRLYLAVRAAIAAMLNPEAAIVAELEHAP